MHILGLANGSIDGNSIILLKAALRAAALSRPNTTTSWIHIPSIAYPPNAGPLASAPDVSLGTNSSNNAPTRTTPSSTTPDDRAVLHDAIMTADALIFSTAVYSHQPGGALKSVLETLLRPYTDAVFAARVLRPRVAGFLTVGGSTTPDQFTMVLPTLHLFAYGMHVKNGSAEWKGLQGSKEKLQEWRDLDVGRVELPSEQQAKVVSTLAQMRL
ncbi:hypothetical protein EJ07DRAFT_171575 [Lizonia empirigonia]|nr:hypothetical protein EJ07DRAFT_171575 [Lizonia empirigonia]